MALRYAANVLLVDQVPKRPTNSKVQKATQRSPKPGIRPESAGKHDAVNLLGIHGRASSHLKSKPSCHRAHPISPEIGSLPAPTESRFSPLRRAQIDQRADEPD